MRSRHQTEGPVITVHFGNEACNRPADDHTRRLRIDRRGASEIRGSLNQAQHRQRFSLRVSNGARGAACATGITLKRLMMTAYNVQGFRIVGGPDWVVSRRWDVQARPDRAVSPGQVRPMLRALLENRFQLHTHSETRQLPVYELSVDLKGSKVQRVKDSETREDVRIGAGSIRLTKGTSATFASQLSYALGRPVIDKTSLAGEFDFALEWTPEPGEDGGPTSAGLPPEPVFSHPQPRMGRRYLRRSRNSWGSASNPGAVPSK